MRDEPRTRRRRRLRPAAGIAAAVMIALGATAPAARAQEGLSAKLSIQFQRVEQDGMGFGVDSLARRFTTTRSLWLQTYEVNHSARIGERLRVLSQFRLTDMNYVDRPEGSRQPYGSLRLTHPFFGVTGTHRPTTTTGAFSGRGFVEGAPDSLGTREITTRDRESALLGYLSLPRAPRLDLSWIRRSREADLFSAGGASETRNAGASYEIGPLRLNGGYHDILRDDPGPGGGTPDQRSLSGGAGLRLSPWRTGNLDFAWDVFDTRRGLEAADPDRSRSHVASFTGNFRPSSRTTWSSYYGYRRSEIEAGTDTTFDDHNASVTVTHAPVRIVQLTGSGGLRTQRVTARADLVRYASALAGVSGRVRKGWQGSASVSHTSNWSGERSAYSIQIVRAGSVFDLLRDLRLRTETQVSANSDSAARGRGTVGTWSGAIEATPWRSLRAELAAQRYQTGPGLFVIRSRSASESLRLQWTPLAAFQLMGYVSRTGALPDNAPRLTTQQLSVRWNPVSQTQLTGSYMKSEQSRTTAVAEQLSGREIYSMQLTLALGPSTRVVAGFSTADPESDFTSRQYDVAFTRRFGP